MTAGGLSTLGVIIGASATLGGLVVVAISLITVLQIHKQVDRRFDDRYAAHQRQLNTQSAQWATGIRYWTQATMTQGVVEAAGLMEQALQAWPSAPGARTEILRRLCDETMQAFLIDVIPGQRRDLLLSDELTALSPVKPHNMRSAMVRLPNSHLDLCQEWLTLALDHEHDDQSATLNRLATVVWAMLRNSPKMWMFLDRWTKDPGYAPTHEESIIVRFAVQTSADWERFQPLTALFSVSGASDLDTRLAAMQETGLPSKLFWMVIPTLASTDTNLIEVSRTQDQQWQLTLYPKDCQGSPTSQSFQNDAVLLTYLRQHFIVTGSVPT